MFLLIPIALLILFAILVQVLGRIRPSPGASWLLSAIFGMLIWISLVLLRIFMPEGLIIDSWVLSLGMKELIIFNITHETWLLGFLLVSVLLAVIFSESTHLENRNFLTVISGSMIITAFGLLAIMARTPLAFILSWTLIDLIELGLAVFIVKEKKAHNKVFSTLVSRLTGTFLMITILALEPAQTSLTTFMSNHNSWLFVLITIFRMGVVPLRLPYTTDISLRRGIGTILRIITPLSAFSFLITISEFSITPGFSKLMQFILVVASLYGAVSWVFSKDALSGRAYWFLSFGSMGVLTAMLSTPVTALALALIMIVGGALSFLCSIRSKIVIPLAIFLIITLSSLPFTPVASIWDGFGQQNLVFVGVLLIINLSLLFFGMIWHIFYSGDPLMQTENWMRFIHILGLFFLILSPWIAEIMVTRQLNLGENWWLSLVFLLMLGLFFLLSSDPIKRRVTNGIQSGSQRETLLSWSRNLNAFLQLNWLASVFNFILKQISHMINTFVRLLEGDGGILWSLLFLVLLVSLISVARRP